MSLLGFHFAKVAVIRYEIESGGGGFYSSNYYCREGKITYCSKTVIGGILIALLE